MSSQDRHNVSQPHCYKLFNEEGRTEHNSSNLRKDSEVRIKHNAQDTLFLHQELQMMEMGDITKPQQTSHDEEGANTDASDSSLQTSYRKSHQTINRCWTRIKW